MKISFLFLFISINIFLVFCKEAKVNKVKQKEVKIKAFKDYHPMTQKIIMAFRNNSPEELAKLLGEEVYFDETDGTSYHLTMELKNPPKDFKNSLLRKILFDPKVFFEQVGHYYGRVNDPPMKTFQRVFSAKHIVISEGYEDDYSSTEKLNFVKIKGNRYVRSGIYINILSGEQYGMQLYCKRGSKDCRIYRFIFYE